MVDSFSRLVNQFVQLNCNLWDTPCGLRYNCKLMFVEDPKLVMKNGLYKQ